MNAPDSADVAKPGAWRCGNVWARTEMFGANPVKQLVVPSSGFPVVSGEIGAMEGSNNCGVWPAARADRPLVEDGLWARLQLGAKPGDSPAGASWNVPRPLFRS